MNKKQKKVLIRVIVASVLLILCAVLPTTGYVRFATFMVPYLVNGYDILKKAWKGILNKQVFDENFLMAVATVGAILLGEYPEGVAVMLFYQIGELFQSYAVGKSRRNISELMDIRPDYANIEVDGKLELQLSLTVNRDFTLEQGLCQEKLDFFNEVFSIQPVIKLKRQM